MARAGFAQSRSILSNRVFYTVELIVFDDDGATHSTVLEFEILAAEPEEPLITRLARRGPSGWVFWHWCWLTVRRRSSLNAVAKMDGFADLAKARTSRAPPHHDATVEEDEARG